jgi:hypothetical protein
MPIQSAMADRRRTVRRRVLALAAAAAAMAGTAAVMPMFAGAGGGGGPGGQSFLNTAETGGPDHLKDHAASGPAARAEARADVAACVGVTATDSPTCPAPAPTARQLTAADVDPDAARIGQWGPLQHIPTNAIHAVVLPTNKVLYFSQPKIASENGGTAHLWDPATGTVKAVPPPVVDYGDGSPPRPANIWCGGQTQLADGRVLVVGGNLAYSQNDGNGAGNGFKGGRWVFTFDPWTETWTRYQDMPHGRWYPTLTELPDGRVLIVGGWDESGGVESPDGPDAGAEMVNNQDVEVFDPAAAPGSAATTVVGRLPFYHRQLGLYPHMFLLPSTTAMGAGGDKVLIAGPGEWDSEVIDTSDWTWNDIYEKGHDSQPRLSQDRAWGTGWLQPAGVRGSTEVELLGGTDSGGAAPGAGTAPPASGSSEVLDLNQGFDDGWQLDRAPDLTIGRAHFNTVLLPDGSAFSSGGGYGRKDGTLYADPVYQAELLSPGASAWTPVGSESDARTYHSTAVLLPDGTVASAGDDRDSPGGPFPDHLQMANRTLQVWSPPYMFRGARPTITAAPARIGYDSSIRVTVGGDPAAIAKAVLIHPAAVTHAVDMGQRVIDLGVTHTADGLALTTPLDASVAPPGYYMLFVVDAAGVPSVASWVHVSADAPVAPAPPPAPPAPATAVAAPAPLPAPRPARLRVSTLRAGAAGHGARVRLTVRLRASAGATARITLTRPGGRAVARKGAHLRAGRTVTRRILLRRSALHGARRLSVRVLLVDGSGRRVRAARTVVVPRPSARHHTTKR